MHVSGLPAIHVVADVYPVHPRRAAAVRQEVRQTSTPRRFASRRSADGISADHDLGSSSGRNSWPQMPHRIGPRAACLGDTRILRSGEHAQVSLARLKVRSPTVPVAPPSAGPFSLSWSAPTRRRRRKVSRCRVIAASSSSSGRAAAGCRPARAGGCVRPPRAARRRAQGQSGARAAQRFSPGALLRPYAGCHQAAHVSAERKPRFWPQIWSITAVYLNGMAAGVSGDALHRPRRCAGKPA